MHYIPPPWMEMDGGHAGVLFRGGIHHPDEEYQEHLGLLREAFDMMLDIEEVQHLVLNDDEFSESMEHYIELLEGEPTLAEMAEMQDFVDEVVAAIQ